MKPELETLFYPFMNCGLDAAGTRCLFLNAQAHPALDSFGTALCYQVFKPYADGLISRGFEVYSDFAYGNGFDYCLVAIPKNMVEARALVARGLQALRVGGVIVAAADNKAGGGRLIKMLEEFGIQGQSESRNKCRVVWAQVDMFDAQAVEAALAAGAVQVVLDGAYVSQPGVFGWDKVDVGSALLASHLPEDFKGIGADFGCGYGYLSRAVMKRSAGVKALHVMDADARAVELCARNIEGVQPRWVDLTRPEGLKDLKGRLDFIVMNPPFHEGKGSDSHIGAAFITQAAACLRRNGVLWMVANAHLPYERILESSFFKVERLAQEAGFKVFKAVV